MNFKFLPLLALLLVGCQSNQAPAEPKTPQKTAFVETALDRYLKRSEPAYKWENAAAGEYSAGDGDANLRLTSQTWQGKDWTHRLQIFTPEKPVHRDAAIINISFGSGTFPETFLGRVLADTTGATVVNVFNQPNQPLYGKTEDDLVAYSFAKFVETGDESWPLLFPITKAAIKSMDAVNDWSTKTRNQKITRFIVTGPSKRGWAAYMVAATDKRVVGVVPIVYNNLNLRAQTQYQREIWGELAPLTKPYQEIGFTDPAFLNKNIALVDAVDPYALRARLTMPKFVIAATNDEFWPLDATKHYLKDLPGQTDLFYVPNATHMLYEKAFAVVGSAANWSRRLLDKKPQPQIALLGAKSPEGWIFTLSPSRIEGENDVRVRLWLASAPTRDFRKVLWKSVPVARRGTNYVATISSTRLWEKGGYAKAFAEVELPGNPSALRISSQLWEAKQ